MTTISDVAALAGVSVATVSRTLHGNTRVDPRTRDRVIAAAAELDYVASPTAASLASGRTNVIAVVAPLMSRWFFASILTTIEQALRERGYHVLLIALEGADVFGGSVPVAVAALGRQQPLTTEMFAKRVDGIILINVDVTDAEGAMLDRLDLPIATIGTPFGDHPRVMIDDEVAVRQALEHLLGLGHTDIGYVGTATAPFAHMATPVARVNAYRVALREAGIAIRPEWVVDSDWTAGAAARDTLPVLTSGTRPSAILAASDEMAVGVLGAARRAGLAVPEDLSVMGIDDHTFAEVLGLSTIRQDVRAQARAAVDLLLAPLQGHQPATHALVLPTELVVRETTAPPPR